MDLDEQADFLHAAFAAWWSLDGQRLFSAAERPAALAAFLAGMLTADSLLTKMAEESAQETE